MRVVRANETDTRRLFFGPPDQNGSAKQFSGDTVMQPQTNREQPGRWPLARQIACRLLAAALFVTAGVPAVLAQCDLSGRWTHTVDRIGTSIWTFTWLGGNRYGVQEQGFGNAQGAALVNGYSVHVEWVTTDGYSITGVADWTSDYYCSSGEGYQVVQNGGWAGTYIAIWDRSP